MSDSNEDVWTALERHGYAITNDHSLEIPERFRQSIISEYFNPWTLCHVEGERPVDRLAARDVIRYQWHDAHLSVQRHDSITITDRAGIVGKRERPRVELLKDSQALELIYEFLRLVPPGRRQSDGTLGVNLLRTFTAVVTAPHQDMEEYIIIYVLDRVGGGGVTCLYRLSNITDDGQVSGNPELLRQLNPGDIIIFEDKLFMHGVTSLTNPPTGTAKRDVLVCTVDYISTYLGNLPG